MWQKSKNTYHLAQAFLARTWYQNPAKDMVVIGVTGTDGKTTTSSLIYHVLEKAGYKAALISTVSAVIKGKEFDTGFHISTPGPWQLQSYLKKAKEKGVTHLVLEVTSHGLDQNRVAGIPFGVGVVTNISREHLDYHETMEAYMRAKGRLLQKSRIVVLNRDDSSYTFFKKLLKNNSIVTFGLTKESDVNPENFATQTELEGEFNLYNTLAAVVALRSIGIEKNKITDALKTFILPKGRFEIVHENEFTVIIDFAHTPNSLEQILQTVKKERNNGKIIHVFGSAGARDHGKRPLMGEKSGAYADTIVLTEEDSRKEAVMDIIEDIKKGIPKSKTVVVIPDRMDAINQAIMLAQTNDTVLITGKGHERSMNRGQGEEPWSEHEAVKQALEYRTKFKKLLA